MTLQEAQTRDLLNAIADAPLTFTWGGTEYANAGTRGALIQRKRFGDGGFLPEPDLSVTTTIKKLNTADNLVDRFPTGTNPEVGDLITISAVVYRVESTALDEFSAGFLMELMSKSKGAL